MAVRYEAKGHPADICFSKEKGDIGTYARGLLDKLRREREDVKVHVGSTSKYVGRLVC